MKVIYTEPQFKGKTAGGHGYERYEREVYCACGKKIGNQTKYENWDDFAFDDKEKANYKFCPYCGNPLN